MEISENLEFMMTAYNLLAMFEKTFGQERLALSFTRKAIQLLLEGKIEEGLASLLDAISMLQMVKDEPGYAQDYYDYLTEERALLNIDEQNNNGVPHISPSNSNLDICTFDDKEDDSRFLGRVETTIWIQVQMKKKD